MAKRTPARHGLRVTTRHCLVGQLLQATTARPLPRLIVHGIDLDARPTPSDLGYAVADARGRFSLTYTGSSSRSTRGTRPPARRIELRVLDRQKREIHKTVVRVSAEPKQIAYVRVPFRAPDQGSTLLLRGLATLLTRQLPAENIDSLLTALETHGIRRLADVRRQGGLHHVEGLSVAAEGLRLIEAYADLSALSSNLELNAALIDRRFTSVASIARASRADIVAVAKHHVGQFKAAQLHEVARARVRALDNVLTGLRADWANGFRVRMRGITNPHIPEWFRRTCDCEACLAAVSPLAYLVDLIDYTLRHVTTEGNAVDLDFLTNTFHQPFGDLHIECDSLDTKVRQVRICIEVLRGEGRPLRDEDQRAYCMETYRDLLSRIGTSYDELRRARFGEAGERTSLATRLGIPPAHVGDLLLQPATITEAALEDIFGFADTSRNPLDAPPTPSLRRWRLDQLTSIWLDEDHPIDVYRDDFLPESGRLPILDPDLTGPDDFRHPVPKADANAADAPFDVWQRRRSWVDDRLTELEGLTEQVNGIASPSLAAMLARMYLAVTYPHDNASVQPWAAETPVDAFDALLRAATSGTAQDVAAATITLETNLRLTADAFMRLMTIRDKDRRWRQGESTDRVTDDEWRELRSILALAQKRAVFSVWRAEEQALGVQLGPRDFWTPLAEPPLRPWLASVAGRLTWRQALDARRAAPIIDPDLLIDTDRLASPFHGPASTHRTARDAWLAEQERSLRVNAAQDGGLTLANLDDRLGTTLGVPASDLEELYQRDRQNLDVRARVEQIDLTMPAFRVLMRIRALVAAADPAAPVLQDEWDDLYSILVQVIKRRAFADWREEERSDAITLSPDHFKKPQPVALEFPPTQPEPLSTWRATTRDLREWDRRLAARIDQRQAVIDGLETAVSDSEEVRLPVLRDAFVERCVPGAARFEEKAKTLADRLLIDTRADGCQMTTRVAQAIETLQSLLWSLRTRQLNDTYPTLELDADDFDDEWLWVGSYAAWRAAVFVFIYPENVLLPTLRRWQTPAFRQLAADLRSARRLTPEQACHAARSYSQYFRDVCHLNVEASHEARTRIGGGSACNTAVSVEYSNLTYLFARPTDGSTVYWSSYDAKREEGYPQSFWDRVPQFVASTPLVGTAVYKITEDQRFLFVFAKNRDGRKLLFSRYDLENRQWDGEPTELDMPEGTLSFEAHVQVGSAARPPVINLEVTLNEGIRYFDRQLDAAGNTWGDGDWLAMNRAWGLWTALPASASFAIPAASAPQVVLATERTHVFVVGDDRQVYTTSSADLENWTAWDRVGDVSARDGDGDVLAAAVSDDRIHLFVVGDEAVFWNVRPSDGAWLEQGAWREIGRPRSSNVSLGTITAIAPGDHQLHVFLLANPVGTIHIDDEIDWVLPEDNRTTFIAYRTSARAPESADAWSWHDTLDRNSRVTMKWGSCLAAASPDERTLFLYATNADARVCTIHWRRSGDDETWSSWNESSISSLEHDGDSETRVTAVASGGSAVDLFVVDQDDAVRTTSSDVPAEPQQWAAWSPVADAEEARFRAGASIGVLRYGAELNALAVGSDGLVYTTWARTEDKPRRWSPWFPVGAARTFPETARAVAARDGRRYMVLVRDSDARLYVTWTQAWSSEDLLRAAVPPHDHPIAAGPFAIGPHNSETDLQILADAEEAAFAANDGAPPSTLTYLEEAYYFVPVHIALQLQSAGQYIAALDWFRTVFDYSAPVDERSIYSGLRRDQEGLDADDDPDVYHRSGEWLLDPLNPHAIATTRPGTYTRFTMLSLARCFLEYGDAEFTLDTAESIARARILYETALELLDTEALKQTPSDCDDEIGELDDEIGDSIDRQWQPAWDGVINALGRLQDRFGLLSVIEDVRNAMRGEEAADRPVMERLGEAQNHVERALKQAHTPRPVRAAVRDKAGALERAYRALLARDHVANAVDRLGAMSGHKYLHAVALAAGEAPDTLMSGTVDLPWMEQRLTNRSHDDGLGMGFSPTRSPAWEEYRTITRLDPWRPTTPGVLANIAHERPWTIVKAGLGDQRALVPEPLMGFCVPPNPLLKALRSQAELNLYKLRTCRNIAGMERQLEPYAAPTDVTSGLPTIAGGQLALPGALTLRPTQHRYAVLVERAKHLVQLAAQMEAAMLSAIEKRDAEAYTVLRARQDRTLASAGVRLQDLRVREAESGKTLAELQQERAHIQLETYETWLAEGTSSWEEEALLMMRIAAGLSFAASAAAVASWTDPSAPFSAAAQGFSSLAAIASTVASFERRRQEWELQRSLAEQDTRIGAQQVAMADDHVRVAGQERVIARIQADHAGETLDFLAIKFTNVELYDWMSGVLERAYAFFLQHATATAQLAATQLAFERQEAPPPFIRSDYWQEAGTDLGSVESTTRSDKRGLTGAARLLRDIYELDQYAFETEKRKLQLTKTISLASLSPAEFQRLRETGLMSFRTTLDMFDRDFPGHYLRLIKRVRVSVIALTSPSQGVRATLSTTGSSRVVVGTGGVFQVVGVTRGPESIALTSPRDATGVFDLEPQPELLLPFEGLGVDTTWSLRMPKAANAFDYRTIADVLISIDYSARDSFDYARQVLQTLSPDLSADRPFSFRHQFADQWYDLHNPDQTATPLTVRFRTVRADFPPNLGDLAIQHVILHVAWTSGESRRLSIAHLRFTEEDAAGAVGGEASSDTGQFSTRTGTAGSWTAMIGKSPVGQWELALPDSPDMRTLFQDDVIDDILLVITYAGRLADWPA